MWLLPGMSVIGEYTTRFDADLAVARLRERGLESTVLGDPSGAYGTAFIETEPSFRLVVRDEVAEHASEVLTGGVPLDHEAEALDALFYQRRFEDRPQWIRWATWSVLVALAGPLLLILLLELWFLSGRIFP